MKHPDIFALRAEAQRLDLRNRVVPAEREVATPAPTCPACHLTPPLHGRGCYFGEVR